ncbi:SpoIIE family protein phosphatase [Streptomyces sp. NBC_01198]|uniref:SpoIIE family protein phosphatase n=1 Tax=Streptomyces sp. NBC_01198 TaxID=2903769 RepID=UPI002E0F69CF|nr:SpoIIE family protein phosphatase [Streptomyces sp. NBC_01198]
MDILLVVDADLRVTAWTGGAERLWGYPADEVIHRSVARLLAPDGPGPAELFAGSPWSGRTRISHGDGRETAATLRVSPLHDGDGGIGWLVWAPGPSARPGPYPAALEALFGHAPVSMVIWDRDLRCVWFNDSVQHREIFRTGPELGGYVTDLIDTRHPAFLESAMAHVLETGVPLLGHELWPAAAEGDDRYFWVSFIRLEGPDGLPLGVCSVVMNVSERPEQGRSSLLSEAENRIGANLDPMAAAQELAETVVPRLADYVTVDLADAIPLGKEPLEHLRSTDTRIPGFYRAGVASIHSDLRESLWRRGTPVYVPPTSPFTAVLHSRASHFEPILDTSPGTWLDNDPDRARVIHATGMHSLMIVPLQARGSMLGIAVFVRTENQVPFTRADLVLAEDLAKRASLSLDNALRYTRERTAALALQRDLLPHHLSGGDAVEVASRYLPSDTHGGVGGDWFDVITMPGGRVALVVGDCIGHGINAAATMGRLRTVVRTLTKVGTPPDELLTLMDELVVEELAHDPADYDSAIPNIGATCLYMVYDPATRRCTMASAGHPPPAIISPDRSVEFADVHPGTPIGVGLGTFEQVETYVAEASVLALYSDGLIETRHSDIDAGLERLRIALGCPVAALDDVCASVIDALVSEGPSDDDIALLLARTLPADPTARG